MSEDSHERVRSVDRIRCHEPVTIRYWGIVELSLPTYLISSFAGFIFVAALIVACNEIVQPQTTFGARTRQWLLHDGWPLEFLPWAPTFLICSLILEMLEVAVVLQMFHRRGQHLRNEFG